MAFKMLDAVTAAATSGIVYLDKPYSKHTVEVSFTSGSAVVIALEGTLGDRGNTSPIWEALKTYTFTADDITAKQRTFVVVDIPVNAVRLNLTTFTTAGGTLTARYEPGVI